MDKPGRIKKLPQRDLALMSEREFLKGLCEDIAQEVAHHIRTIYPEVAKAAPSTFLLSVKGSIINEIMAVLDFKGNQLGMYKRLAFRRKFRKHIESQYRKIRKERA